MCDANSNSSGDCCQLKLKVTDFFCRAFQGKLTSQEKKMAVKAVGIAVVVIAAISMLGCSKSGKKCNLLPILAGTCAIGFAASFVCKVKKALKKKGEEIKDLQSEIKTLNFRIDQQNELFLKEISRLQKLVNEKTSNKSSDSVKI